MHKPLPYRLRAGYMIISSSTQLAVENLANASWSAVIDHCLKMVSQTESLFFRMFLMEGLLHILFHFD